MTRKPFSIKKLRVVCQAEPRSSKVPRPRPSRFHNNSFRPFETREVSLEEATRVVPTAAAGRLLFERDLSAEPAAEVTERDASGLGPLLGPMPNLLSRLMI